MASKKKIEEIKEEIKEEVTTPVVEQVIEPAEEIKPEKTEKKEEKVEKAGKFKVGDIVFVSKDADADLNGFKLFPQYKKYTYTVEAYDAKSDVYTLRRLNLSLKLKSNLILAPNERGDQLSRKQF